MTQSRSTAPTPPAVHSRSKQTRKTRKTTPPGPVSESQADRTITRTARRRGTKTTAPAIPPLLPLYSYLYGAEGLGGKMIVDLFAGGGGVSTGIELALGRSPDVAVNHNSAAIHIHTLNHPNTVHYQESVFEVDPLEATGGREVALLWLSPDCRHFSRARGGKPLNQQIRSLPWVGIKWAGKLKPDVIIMENVPEIEGWTRLIPERGYLTVNAKGKTVKVNRKDLPWPNKPKRRGKACRGYRKPVKGQKPWKMPVQHPPRGPILRDEHGQALMVADPSEKRKGRTFKRFVKCLRDMGYVVEFRNLKANEYGAPTIRERFFLIARRDGKAIVWPEPTHGPGLIPERTAAECIDWTLPTYDVFDVHDKRTIELVDNTFARIAKGLDKFVLGTDEPFLVPESPSTGAPFLVQTAHGGHNCRQRSVGVPLSTIIASGPPSLATPFLTPMTFDNAPTGVDRPIQTITTQGNRQTLITPFLAPRYGERDGQEPRCVDLNRPIPTITAGANTAQMVTAHITKFRQGSVGSDLNRPIDTICAGGHSSHPGGASIYGMVAVSLVKHYGGFCEQTNIPVDGPLGTITASDHHALLSASLRSMGEHPAAQGAFFSSTSARLRTPPTAAPLAFIVQNQGQSTARSAGEPLSGMTAGTVHHGVVAAHVLRQFGSSDGRPVNAPLGSQTSTAKDGLITSVLHPAPPTSPTFDEALLTKAAQVYDLLEKHCPKALEKLSPEDRAQRLVTVTLNGEKHLLYAVQMRMLSPRELFNCQGFPGDYIIDGNFEGKPLPKHTQIRLVGNSVPPVLVQAIVGAQFRDVLAQAAD